MRTLRRPAGFTLVELMIVLGIVGILTTIAIATTVGNRPRQRLVAATADIRLQLLQARTSAVKKDRNLKVCIFRDDSAVALPPKGRIVVFECGDRGLATCAGAPICLNEPANPPANQWDTSEVDCTDPAKWCKIDDIDFNGTLRANERISVNRFLDGGNVVSARDSIELTYLPSGGIDRIRSSMTSGSVELTNHDQCTPSTDACTDFQNRMRVAFTSGGGARIVE